MPQSNDFRRKRRAEWKARGVCTTCGKYPPEPGGTSCQRCRDYYRMYNAKFKGKGLCKTCRKRKPDPGWTHCDYCLESERARRAKLKDEVFTAYGGYCCTCCGENNKEFLQIDHVNNDGGSHRREIGCVGGSGLYGWLKRNGFPPGFQVLCANCNYAKSMYGYCPHKSCDKEVTGVQRHGRRKHKGPHQCRTFTGDVA